MTDEEKDSFKNEIAYKIYNSSIQRYPYAYSETSNFLPSSLFDEILANIGRCECRLGNWVHDPGERLPMSS